MHLVNVIIKHSKLIIPIIITALIPVTSGCHSTDVTNSSSIYDISDYITSQETVEDSIDTPSAHIEEVSSETDNNPVTPNADNSDSDNNYYISDTVSTGADDSPNSSNADNSNNSHSSPDADDSDISHSSPDADDSDISHSSPDADDSDISHSSTNADDSDINDEHSNDNSNSSNKVNSEHESSNPNSWLNNLSASANHNQLIIVSANGSRADVSMYVKTSSSSWETIVSANGFVGMEGVGTASEYSSRTPAGIFSLSLAFGVNSNPGTSLPYTHVDSSHYWVDDPDSTYYNQFVSTNYISPDWSSAEHIVDYPGPYAYAIAIDYNTSCVKGAGSAIFLHCSNGSATYGCVSVPTQTMITILNNINPGCAIIIDNEWNITNY